VQLMEKESVGTTTSKSRVRTFRAIAGIMAVSAVAFGVFTALFGIVSEAQAIHAFHNVVVAALLLVFSAPPAISAARAPERAVAQLLHLSALGVAGLATMAVSVTIDIYTLPFVVLVGMLLLLRVPRGPALGVGRPSVALGILVTAAAVPLVAYALGQAELQRIDTSSDHAELNHWVEMSFYAVAVLLLGAVAALRPTTFRMPAWSAGIALAVMGGASLALEGYASALGTSGAWAALVGGVLFIFLTEWEVRQAQHRARRL
jgi:hypothetical protein